jgi:hypothetical protein
MTAIQPFTLGAIAATALLTIALQGTPAQAGSGDEIGDARTIISIVKADFDKQERELTIGDVVRQDEVIEVSDDGKGEFRLNDDTKLALGPGSRMVLDKFVYDSDKKAGSIVLDLTKGAFRFITGVATKPTYQIRTPNASITVRGTIFDAFVLPDDSAWLLLHEGAIEVTSEKNVCHVLDRPGQLIRIDETGTVSKPVNWKDMPGRDAADFDVAFPFVGTTPQIEPLPTTTRTGVIEAAFPEADPKACANTEKPKIQKANDDDKPKKKSKKRQAANDDDYSPPRKVVKRKKYEEPQEDYGEGGARAMDIIIRGGMGGGYRPGGYGGGGRGMGGTGGYGGK